MKKIFAAVMFLVVLSTNLYAADQWDKTDPAGTENMSDIDTLIQANNAALDRLVINYKRGLGVNYATAATLSVLAGELAIPNAAGSIVRWRRTTAATPIDWSMIDTGSEQNSTQYYLYATADTDITDMLFKISASSSAPSGITYYRKIATFYNNASGNIENVISLRPDDGTDYPDVVEAWINFTGTGTITINDQHNVSSITDNGTGSYTVTFNTSFANAYYAVSGTASSTGNEALMVAPLSQSTGSVTIETTNGSGTSQDATIVNLICSGDRV